MELAQLIDGAARLKASDIHFIEDSVPYIRVGEDLMPVKHPPITREMLERMLDAIIPDRLRRRLEESRAIDISYELPGVARCRVVIFHERRRLSAVFRILPIAIPTPAELELPDVVEDFIHYQRGLVLLTGPTGCGKTSTLASLIDQINIRERVSIVTVEDPIEYVYQNKHGVVRQREIGDDVMSFSEGVVQALRQDPDVILVGEMRNLETMQAALTAAQTGHLVFSTLHTSGAIQTIERIVGTFPESDHPVLFEELALNLKVVMTQELLKRAEGKGRIAAVEIMVVNEHVAKLIRDHHFDEIWTIMKTGANGMLTLDQSLARLVNAGKIAEADAARYARDIHALHRYITHKESSGDRGGVLG